MHEETYTTKDLNVSTYLVVSGYKPLGTEWRNNKVYFIFPSDASQAVAMYRITPDGEYVRKLLQAYRTIQGLVIEERVRRRDDAA